MHDGKGMTTFLIAKLSCCGLLLLALSGSLASWVAWAVGDGLVYLSFASLAAVALTAALVLRRLHRRPAGQRVDPATFRPLP